MLSAMDEILGSKIFTFVVGEKERPFPVHAAALAQLSEPLDRLIYGSFSEAQENTARITWLEGHDFERICEFAYRGEYRTPFCDRYDLERKPEDSIIYHNENLDDKIRFAFYNTEIPKNVPESFKTGLGRLKTHFRARRYYENSIPELDSCDLYSPWNSSDRSLDFAPVFVCFARIYAFAQLYLVPDLKQLTLHKLHCTLRFFTLYTTSMPAIMELLRYVYDNDYIPDRGNSNDMDPLRELVVEYMEMHTRDFATCEDHRRFLNEEGGYSGDLLQIVQKWRL